jgi:hypothetical protein
MTAVVGGPLKWLDGVLLLRAEMELAGRGFVTTGLACTLDVAFWVID